MAGSDDQWVQAVHVARRFMQTSFTAMQTIRTEMREQSPHGLSVPQFRALMALRHLRSASVSELAEDLELSRPAISRLVDGLVAKDLVSRVEAPDDRRRVTLTLTTTGREEVDAVDRELVAVLAQRLVELTDPEQQTVRAALDILGHAFGVSHSFSPPAP